MHYACLAGPVSLLPFKLHFCTQAAYCVLTSSKSFETWWFLRLCHLQVLETVARQCKEAMLAEQDSFRGVISELDHAVTALQSSTDLAAVGSVHEQVSATACQSHM